jgi:hypothetical protein
MHGAATGVPLPSCQAQSVVARCIRHAACNACIINGLPMDLCCSIFLCCSEKLLLFICVSAMTTGSRQTGELVILAVSLPE